jgi:hypothetical protein
MAQAMAKNQAAGRNKKQKYIYLFFDLRPNFARCYASSFNHLSIPSRPPFSLSADAARGRAEAQ